MGCCSVRCGLIAGIALGTALVIVGAVLFPVGDSAIRDTVSKEAVIENGTTAYDNWVASGAAVYRQFWLFEVQNPMEVVQLGAKPVLAERGPYTYKTRYLPKENITANSNHTISFSLPSGAIFQPDMSAGAEEDTISCLNLAVASRTVRELLWGYYDPIRRGTVAIFDQYNETSDGPYNVFTGKDDIAKVSVIDRWRGERKLDFWNDTYCDMINGTDASSFPPFLDRKKPLYFFSSDICRSVSADFERSVVLKGIELYRFTLNPLTMAAPTDNPDNHCYCRDSEVTGNCTKAGVLDVSSCRGGTPIYISLPHFLHGSSSLTQDMTGLKPSPQEHFTFLDVEPITGITMRFAKRLQVNMMYGPSKTIDVLKKVKDYTIFPLLWLNETAAVDQETADMFRAKVTSRVQTVELLRAILLGVGSVLVVACSIALAVTSRRRKAGR